METRWGMGEGGSDLEACESAGFPGPAFSFFFFSHCLILPLSLSLLLLGINTFQRMSIFPLAGERASHSGRQNGRSGVDCVSTVGVYVCS